MRVRFLGTRGSIATPGSGTLKYGGNTSCVEVVTRAGTRIVLDAGTGIASLGRELAAAGTAGSGTILISHTHWDHICGFPFFGPLFVPGNFWDVYGPGGLGQSLRETLAGQMQYTYFPVTLEELGATVRYIDLVEGSFSIGEVEVTARYLNHPALALGYRLEADGVTVVYACDHEPHARDLAAGRGPVEGEDARHAEFVAGADLLIHDAQYFADEYPAKVGWGHSTWEYVRTIGRHARVKRVALTHHEPAHEDAAIDRMLAAQPPRPGEPEFFAAYEGQTLELAGVPRSDAVTSAPVRPVGVDASAGAALLAFADEHRREQFEAAAAADHIAVITAPPREAAAMAASERPALLLLDDGRDDPVAICRAVRAIPGYGGDVPIVRVTESAASVTAPFTDQLVEPVSPSYARARLRAWINRAALRWVPAPQPVDEPERIAALRAMDLLDTPPEERFDRFTRLAASLFGVPIALVTLIDSERQWFKSKCGLATPETPRDQAFCAHVVYERMPVVVADARSDWRFADNPLVTGLPFLRFYAGVPLMLPSGAVIGTFCIADTRPRHFVEKQLDQLRDLGRAVLDEVAFSAGERELARLLQAVTQAADMIFIATNPHDARESPVITFANDVMERELGYGPGELVGKLPSIAYGPLTDTAVTGRIVEEIHAGREAGGAFRTYRKNGSSFWGEWNGRLVVDESTGRPFCWFAIGRKRGLATAAVAAAGGRCRPAARPGSDDQLLGAGAPDLRAARSGRASSL